MMSFLKSITLACATLLPTTALADWNGWYVGGGYGELSNGSVELDIVPGLNDTIEDSDLTSAFFGRLNQSGNVVTGYEIALSFVEDVAVPGFGDSEVENPLYDVKFRLGYAANIFLPYATIGISGTNIQGSGVDFPTSGFSFGAGIDVQLTDNFFVGAEYLSRQTNDDVEATNAIGGVLAEGELETSTETITLRVGFKF